MRIVPLLAAMTVAAAFLPAVADAAPSSGALSPAGTEQQFTLYDGSKVTLGPDGMGTRTDPRGNNPHPFTMTLPQAVSAGGPAGPSRADVIHRLSAPARSGPTGDIVLGLSAGSFDAGGRAAHTTDARVNASLRAIGASNAIPLHATGSVAAHGSFYLVHTAAASAAQAAATLRHTPGVSYAEPDQYVSTMNVDPVPLPSWPAATAHPFAAANELPTNYGLQSSMQTYLNAGGVDLAGGYADITGRLHELPGHGEIITNVSLGDLTDQSMADSGDQYVKSTGPTTVVENGQRYLDYPSLPKIPTYTVDPSGALDPLGSVEHVDPNLSEVLLDFSTMAPLPHDQQRPENMGDGPTDLLGIAPGAQYRLVEPTQPTSAGIATALLAAARQTPRPNVINASLGFGTDVVGYPGRYLEDDPFMRSVVSSIVNDYGIVVTISSNDGTRLYTPAGVGPDGGSTPTNRPRHHEAPTAIEDDGQSTIPSVVPDSGAIDVGGTTTDDTIAIAPQAGGPLSRTGTFAETRLNGMTAFSSGFGTRVDVSAPSDNIPSLMHCAPGSPGCLATGVTVTLNGGTSASAPMTAAAVADLLQVGRATGHRLTPAAVRQLLEETGRAVPTQPQVDRQLPVGPQIDITRAVEKLLGSNDHPMIVRLSTAHRVSVPGSANAKFVSNTDPSAIDLAGPLDPIGNPTGEALFGPITFGLDATGLPRGLLDYVLRVGSREFHTGTPSVRVMPAEVLAAAGQPVSSTTNRIVPVTFEIRHGHQVIARTGETLTFGPADGVHGMAPAPVVAPVTPAGTAVQVHYDLTGVPSDDLNKPELMISPINHWSAYSAPLYRIAFAAPLTATTGTITVPASVFSAGGGVYGATVLQDSENLIGGAAAAFRIAGGSEAQRPDAPTLAATGASFGHQAVVTRTAPSLHVRWDARSVAGATGAALEISAPGPTLYNLLNTFTNQYGTTRDANGVDSPSAALITLPGAAGTTSLDLHKLGVPSSLLYAVRVLATRHGQVVGQASPSSSLEFDDAFAPDGGQVLSFDINPDGASTVATVTRGADGYINGSSLLSYDPATARYGPAYAHDGSGQYGYYLFGSDPGNHRLIAESARVQSTEQHLLTYDTADRHQVSDQTIDAGTQYLMKAGRVDAAHHRADLLVRRGEDQADMVVPVDTGTGATGTAVIADNGTPSGRYYSQLDVEQATGKVDLVGPGPAGTCGRQVGAYTTVDLVAGTAAPMSRTARCPTGVASDQNGHAIVTIGPLPTLHNLMSPAGMQRVDEASGAVGDEQSLGASAPVFPTVDTKNGLLVVGYLGGADYQINNNGMSAVGVYDLNTGARVSFREQFNLITAFNGPEDFTAERGIQIDPATRTGWTYSPYGDQIQQFHY